MAKEGRKPGDPRRSKDYKQLKASLVESLQARGLVEQVYLDKVDEYMEFWALTRELEADIAARGLTVMDERGRMSENRSVSLKIQVSRQMLAIFTAMGFKDEAARGGNNSGGDWDEL